MSGGSGAPAEAITARSSTAEHGRTRCSATFHLCHAHVALDGGRVQLRQRLWVDGSAAGACAGTGARAGTGHGNSGGQGPRVAMLGGHAQLVWPPGTAAVHLLERPCLHPSCTGSVGPNDHSLAGNPPSCSAACPRAARRCWLQKWRSSCGMPALSRHRGLGDMALHVPLVGAGSSGISSAVSSS